MNLKVGDKITHIEKHSYWYGQTATIVYVFNDCYRIKYSNGETKLHTNIYIQKNFKLTEKTNYKII